MKNEIISFNEFSKIILKDSEGTIVGQAIVDNDVIDDVSRHRWHLTNSGYVIGYDDTNKTKFLLHNYILGTKDGYVVDHIDHNPLNNRKSNLRHFTYSLNSHTAKLSSRNTTGKKGVYAYKTSAGTVKYRAQIIVDGIIYRLGSFDTFSEAVKSRQEAELKHLGFVLNY